MPKLGLSGGRTCPRHENGVLLAYAVTPAKMYYVKLSKKRQEVSFKKTLPRKIEYDNQTLSLNVTDNNTPPLCLCLPNRFFSIGPYLLGMAKDLFMACYRLYDCMDKRVFLHP